MRLIYQAMNTDTAEALWAGAPDSNGQRPEPQASDGNQNPCRHCLTDIPAGAPMLVFGHRPFPEPQPYAEIGPIFLCANPCERAPETSDLPAIFDETAHILVRGYGADDRIRYGTGTVVPMADAEPAMRSIFEDSGVAYIHMRSASNNCFQCRVERG